MKQCEVGALDILEAIGMWPAFAAVLAMVSLVFVGVVTRFFGHPLPFVDEYVGYLVAVVVFMALSYVLKRKAHVAVKFLPNALPPRGRTVLELSTLLISLGVVTLLLVATANLVISAFETGRTAWTVMETPLWPVLLIMPIGFRFFIIEILIQAIKMVKSLFTHQ